MNQSLLLRNPSMAREPSGATRRIVGRGADFPAGPSKDMGGFGRRCFNGKAMAAAVTAARVSPECGRVFGLSRMASGSGVSHAFLTKNGRGIKGGGNDTRFQKGETRS